MHAKTTRMTNLKTIGQNDIGIHSGHVQMVNNWILLNSRFISQNLQFPDNVLANLVSLCRPKFNGDRDSDIYV